MVDIIDLCEYIIYYSNIKDHGMSCLKLQKILYFLQDKCEKPTPLGVGWIAQNKKNNVYVDIGNIHIL